MGIGREGEGKRVQRVLERLQKESGMNDEGDEKSEGEEMRRRRRGGAAGR